MRSTINKLMRILEAEGIQITNPKPGVRWNTKSKKWQTVIKVNGISKSLGYFTDLCDAIEARNAAELKHFPNGRQPKRTKTQPEAVPEVPTLSPTVGSTEDDDEDGLEAEFYD